MGSPALAAHRVTVEFASGPPPAWTWPSMRTAAEDGSHVEQSSPPVNTIAAMSTFSILSMCALRSFALRLRYSSARIGKRGWRPVMARSRDAGRQPWRPAFWGPPARQPVAGARLIGAPSPALARSWGGLCGVGHPGFVAFAAVAPTIPMTVPIRSAVTSRPFGGSTSGGVWECRSSGQSSTGWHWERAKRPLLRCSPSGADLAGVYHATEPAGGDKDEIGAFDFPFALVRGACWLRVHRFRSQQCGVRTNNRSGVQWRSASVRA